MPVLEVLGVSGRLVLSSLATDQIINGQRPDAAKVLGAVRPTPVLV